MLITFICEMIGAGLGMYFACHHVLHHNVTEVQAALWGWIATNLGMIAGAIVGLAIHAYRWRDK